MSKIKSSLLAASLLSSMGLAVADVHNMSGPYVGAQLGGTMLNTKYKIDGSPFGQNIANMAGYTNSGAKNFTGGVFVGFDKMASNRMVVGLQLGANLKNVNSSQTITYNGATLKYDIRARESYTLLGSVGSYINSFLMKFIVGVEYAKIETVANANNFLYTKGNPAEYGGPYQKSEVHGGALPRPIPEVSGKKTEFVPALVLGGDFSTIVTKNMAMGLAATWSLYKTPKSKTLQDSNSNGQLRVRYNMPTEMRVVVYVKTKI